MMESTDIILILDASGSMNKLRNDTVGGYNKFINEQKAQPGDAYITLVTFDTTVNQRYISVPVANVGELTAEDYDGGHGGGTALFDAVGKEIVRYEGLGQKADKTLFVIDTDGEENQSKEWNLAGVKALIERCKEKGWAFVFLGANDSAWQGERMGAQSVGHTVATSSGVAAKYGMLSHNTAMTRSSVGPAAASAATMDWNSGEDEAK